MSRNSLREAVRALSLIHVLDVWQGDGTYVTSLEPHLLLSAMEFVVDFHHDDTVLHLLEVRRILEPAACAAAATKLTEAELDALTAHLDELPDDPTPEELVDSDLIFHRTFAEGSGNPLLASLLETIAGPTHRARIWRGLTSSGRPSRPFASIIRSCPGCGPGNRMSRPPLMSCTSPVSRTGCGGLPQRTRISRRPWPKASRSVQRSPRARPHPHAAVRAR